MSAEGGWAAAAREQMVERHLKGRDITDERVLSAFRKVERHLFTTEPFRRDAYEDEPLPIGEGQTISQPYMVALMTQALGLKGGEKALEIGTGSGYQAAILAELARDVHTIERSQILAERAEKLLTELGYANITVHKGDGTLGLPECAPFDAILVTAGGPRQPQSLLRQLDAKGGVMVMPVGNRLYQTLVKITRNGDNYENEDLGMCRFVPLVGEEGW